MIEVSCVFSEEECGRIEWVRKASSPVESICHRAMISNVR